QGRLIEAGRDRGRAGVDRHVPRPSPQRCTAAAHPVQPPGVPEVNGPCAHPSVLASTAPSLHPPPERISPDPDALLHALVKRIWCSASFSPGNTRARPRASSRKVRRTLILFASIASTASR